MLHLKHIFCRQVKAIEAQLEEDYSEKQSIMKEKRELERKLNEMNEIEPQRNIG